MPLKADRILYLTAPILIFAAVFTGFSVLPVAPGWAGSGAESGVLFLLAIVALDVIGIVFAGWGANSKFTLLGGMRSASQMIAYEVPLTLSVLCVVMVTQTLDLQEISYQQGILADPDLHGTRYFLGVSALGIDVNNIGGFMAWNIFTMPLLIPVAVIFFIASLAECNRAPFDLPEAESELVGGYHTEYSGFRWSVVMLAEYGLMLLVSILAAVLFLGSWNTPFPDIGPVKLASWTSGATGTVSGYIWGIFWLFSKSILLVLVQIWIRWTYPRLRIDQLMTLGWKYLTPVSLVLIFFCAVWRLLFY